ncbi:alpha/beta hydrolase [Ralstonia solanacearum]|uniref:alpha/beta hydrolase n=1 Tax=Ralstonia solanacearum TaxID=305 RepID=UPI001E408CE1|nr:alpha/beta hydrolase [Ralstonia solanacearum]
MLCHAWGGRGTQLADFVPALLARGYEVLAFDAPGHGDSDGKQTDMVAYTRLIAWMAERFGPLHAIIGHSFGAGNTIIRAGCTAFPSRGWPCSAASLTANGSSTASPSCFISLPPRPGT